ncbi:MAG: ArsR/SmtB family transcription factor [Nitrososphaerales archaeon]
MFKETSEEVERFLNILGNETRRKILYLLAEEPRYFIQISRDLRVSQQAVLKHLELLERFGLITSYRVKSDLAAPERKYYRLNRSLYLSIGITEDNMNIQLRNISQNQNEAKRGFRDLVLNDYVESSIENDESLNSLLKSSHYLLKKIDERIGELERHKVSLLKLKQNVMKRVHDAVYSSFDSLLERSVLYSLVASDAPLDVAFLSEQLGVREKEIERCVEALRRRLALPFE